MKSHNTPTTMKYARQCSVSGAGMNKGYCICDGEAYVSEAVGIDYWLKEHTSYESAEEAYEDGYYYYTEWEEWEDEDDYQYEECSECGYVDDAVASHYEECSKLDPQTHQQ